MPTFAEGFGLPVVEGLAAGIPVIASNLEVFREMGAERITLIDPIDGEAWLKAIRVSAESHPAGDALKQARGLQKPVPDLKDYFFKIDEFLTSL
jgi:glycosyltransferase involved in cell wall biosynthesis